MTEYFILTFYVLIISLIKFKNKKAQLFLCFFPFFIFIATRIGWTADYYNYEEMFELQHYWTWNNYLFYSFKKFEFGFFFLIKILPTYRALLVVVSFFYTFAILFLFYKYIPKNYYFIAFFLWFFNSTFFESFAAVRSSIVIAFFIFSAYFKLKGNNLLALILIFISTFFHLSGLLLIPLILIPKDFVKKHYIFTSIASLSIIVITLIFPALFGDSFITLISDTYFEDYSGYINETSYGIGYYIFTLFRMLFIIYFLYLVKRDLIKEEYLWFVFIIILYYVVASIPNIEIFYRFKVYLNPFIIALQCYVLLKDKTSLSTLYIILAILYMLFSFYSFFDHPNYIPFFQNYESTLSSLLTANYM